MSELHQYEIHFTERTLEGVIPDRVSLEWAYSAADALEQFKIRGKYRTTEVREIGPVKKEIWGHAGPVIMKAHFHVCRECQQIHACRGCDHPEGSESLQDCAVCAMKSKRTP